ncbi:condensation domain-containing protein [Streptomyces sp. NPDC098789]|uniref:condensation domain-containing protein n=1 Tax=Streptomyces sp. NPDC098789 TaxID=3366098 RepID=UPI0037F149AC
MSATASPLPAPSVPAPCASTSTVPALTEGVPLTAAQSEFLAAQSAAPGYAGHHVGQYVELFGPIDTEALRDAVAASFDEAPWLRFRLTRGDDGPRQSPVREPGGPRRPALLDTSGAADPVAAALDLVRGRLACPPRLDLLADPPTPGDVPDLAGSVLVAAGPEHHLLVQFFHQLAVDGHGLALLGHRIAEHYTAAVHGRPAGPSPFAPVTALVAAESAYAASPERRADLAAWTRHLAGVEPPPPLRGRSAPPADTAVRRTVLLGPADTAAVEAAAREAGATWGEAVLAVTALHTTSRTGAAEAVLAVYAAARTAPGTLRVPAAAVNILPVRIPAGPADTFRSLLARAAVETSFLRRHQRVRGSEVAREVWPDHPGGRVPGPLVNLRPFETELDFAGVPGRVVSLASGPVDDLAVAASRSPEGLLRLDFDANPALYRPTELECEATAFAALLAGLARRPGTPAGQVRAAPARPDPDPELDPIRSATAPGAPAAGTGPWPSDPARTPPPPADREQGPLTLLPAAHRLRSAPWPVERAREHVLLRTPAGLRTAPLRRALATLGRRHPALRLALHQAHGVWSQQVRPAAAAPAVTGATVLRRHPVAGLAPAARTELLARAARAAGAALDPATGAVFRAVWLDAGADGPGRLLLAAHALCVDDVSWQLLTAELPVLYAWFAGDGARPEALGPPGGLTNWAAALAARAQSPDRVAELPYWTELSRAPAPRAWPAAEGGHRTRTRFDVPAPAAGAAGPHPVDTALLTALARVAAGRPRLHDGTRLPVELELPRPEGAPATVGRLSTVHGVRLPLDPDDPGAVRRALAAVPDGGRGQEQLRHLNPQTSALAAGPRGRGVGYRRRAALSDPEAEPGWGPAPAEEWPAPGALGDEPPLTGPVDVTATVRAAPDGGYRVDVDWRWSAALFDAAEALALSETATALAARFARQPH